MRKEFFDDSSMVILLATEYDGFIAASSVTDIYYIEHKRNHDKEKTKVIVDKLLGYLKSWIRPPRIAIMLYIAIFQITKMLF